MKKAQPTRNRMQRSVVIMVKEPRPGRVKTRLGTTIGMTQAAWWFRHQSQQLIRRLGSDSRWQCILAVSPDREGISSRVWPRGMPRIEQGNGDLGIRMGRIFRNAPPGPCLIIGADIPNITNALIWDSFGALRSKDAVIGPADDGGYWLVGVHRGSRAFPQTMFRDIRWSGPFAMQDTIASFGQSRIGYTATLSDVDTEADLIALNQSRSVDAPSAFQSG